MSWFLILKHYLGGKLSMISAKQWAAVRTCCAVTRLPPHWRSNSDSSFKPRETIHGTLTMSILPSTAATVLLLNAVSPQTIEQVEIWFKAKQISLIQFERRFIIQNIL